MIKIYKGASNSLWVAKWNGSRNLPLVLGQAIDLAPRLTLQMVLRYLNTSFAIEALPRLGFTESYQTT